MNNKIKKLIAKKNRSKIICLTAYSKNIASILDKHCDIVLVGDSLGSVLYNYKSTKQVTFKTMIEHSKSVKLGVKKSLMVVDMPFNTYRRRDIYVRQSKIDGYRARSAYKLIEIDQKFKIFKNGISVIDLGAAPGSWSQYSSKVVKNGRIVYC